MKYLEQKNPPALFLFHGIKPNFVNSVNAYSGSEEFVVFNIDLCSEQQVQSFWLHYAKFQEFFGMREKIHFVWHMEILFDLKLYPTEVSLDET